MNKNSYYSKHYIIDKKRFDLHYAMFFSNPAEKILDVGCSVGNFLVHCSRKSWGVDIDNSQLEIRRVLKPGGKLILRTPNAKYWKFRMFEDYTHKYYPTKESLEMMCIDAGFKSFEIKYIKHGMFGARKLFNAGVNPSFIRRMMLF